MIGGIIIMYFSDLEKSECIKYDSIREFCNSEGINEEHFRFTVKLTINEKENKNIREFLASRIHLHYTRIKNLLMHLGF